MAKKRPKKTRSRAIAPRGRPSAPVPAAGRLLGDIRGLIERTRAQVARTVNSAIVALYWQIGKRIREDILHEQRAGYGGRIVSALSRQLTLEYGRGFGRRNLFRMMQFAEFFPHERIVSALSAQLGWSHFIEILSLDTPLKRDFYAEMCRIERWSVRTLRQKIDRMLFERTAVAKKPEELIRADLDALRDEDRLTPDLVFRDPYFLDFLGLTGSYCEKDVEHAILRRLVAIDLKIGKFQAADKGQMELYLRWLEENEMQPGEEPPLGLVLCAGKTEGHVRLLKLAESGIHAAQYLTELPPQDVLERKLFDAVRLARERLARQAQDRLTTDNCQLITDNSP